MSEITFYILLTCSFVLLGLLGALLFFNLKELRELRNKVDTTEIRSKDAHQRIDKYLTERNLSISSASSATQVKTFLEKHIDRLQDQIDELKSKISNIDRQVYDMRYEVNDRQITILGGHDSNKNLSTSSASDTSKKRLNEEVVFLTTPNQDGSFEDGTAQLIYKDLTTIYQLNKTSPNRGTFQIVSRDGAIGFALQRPNIVIDPVCEPENAWDQSIRTIETVPDGLGEAELIDGRWKVTKKAKIRYVS